MTDMATTVQLLDIADTNPDHNNLATITIKAALPAYLHVLLCICNSHAMQQTHILPSNCTTRAISGYPYTFKAAQTAHPRLASTLSAHAGDACQPTLSHQHHANDVSRTEVEEG
jgi:hypothetical protein